MKNKCIKFIKKYFIEIIIFTLFLAFSFWLMFSTFSYNRATHEFLISLKPWGDFASHIPLIRSFSYGQNFPPQYPLFPGEPIRYHFLFYFFVGMLEKIGLPIDLALNLPSALSFFFLLIMIYLLARLLFKIRFVAVLSVVFFLFNGSFSFFYFFQKHPFSFSQTFFDILQNDTFPAFAPYDKTLISGGFWNLNVFTNQRHFAGALTIILLVVYFLTRNEQLKKTLSIALSIIFGILIGVLSLLHGAAFIMIIAVLGSLFFLFPQQRKPIILIGIIALITSLPRIIFLWQIESGGIFQLNPGYLIIQDLSLLNWLRYWILNLGIGSLLIPLGFVLANKTAKKIFIAFSSIFIIGNLFQFSPDIATNHKFFNLWLIVANMFIAFVLFLLWQKKLWQKTLVIILIFFLTLSGIIDLFPIKNDQVFRISDYPTNLDVKWIIENTPKEAIFLNSSYLYHPANLAGRKIFLGWPYFSWSLGYNTTKREELLKKLYNPPTLIWECQILKENKIDYISLDKNPDLAIVVNKMFFVENFEIAYQNNETGFTIFNPLKKCKRI